MMMSRRDESSALASNATIRRASSILIRLAFDQPCDLAVVSAEHQISFPVTRHGAILGGCGAFADRHGTDDLPVDLGLLRVMPRPTHGAGAPQVLEEFLLQGTTRLDEEGAVDGLV
jgi:hypothetical protein